MQQTVPIINAKAAIRVTGFLPKAQSPQEIDQERPSVAANGLVGSIPGGVPIDNEKIASLLRIPIQIPRIALPTKVRVSSGVMRTLLIKKVSPEYPLEAVRQRVGGTVVLRINIEKNGNVSHVEAVSGDSLLIPAAIEAVQQWKYKPYLLNQVPVEVETAVQINFVILGTNPTVLITSLHFGQVVSVGSQNIAITVTVPGPPGFEVFALTSFGCRCEACQPSPVTFG